MGAEDFWQVPALSARRALCFTGHRPEKLPTGRILRLLTDTLHYYIDKAIAGGYTCFYTGLADGIDYYAAEYLFTQRKVHPEIRIVGVQPCEDYEAFFLRRQYSTARLAYMLHTVDKVIVLPGTYRDPQVFLRRNRYMVDHSRAVIAVCGDGRSGSIQTLSYARRSGLAGWQLMVEQDPDDPVCLLRTPETWPVREFGFAE